MNLWHVYCNFAALRVCYLCLRLHCDGWAKVLPGTFVGRDLAHRVDLETKGGAKGGRPAGSTCVCGLRWMRACCEGRESSQFGSE